jgi:hypothetical protein
MNAEDFYWRSQVESDFTLAEQFEKPEYMNMWIPMKEALYDIDYSIGRNRMITYLKIKGILDHSGKPILGNKDFNFFRVEPIQKVRSYTAHYYNFNVYYITAKGILEIRRMIKASRLAGANI